MSAMIVEVEEHTRKLPPYETLKREFLAGMTHSQLAAKYGCSERAVNKTLRARAMRRGEWPLLTPQQYSRRYAVGSYVQARNVRTLIIRSLLLEYLEAERLTTKEFALRHGLRWTFVRDVRMQSRPTISVESAVKILDAIGEPVPTWMRTSRPGRHDDTVPGPECRATRTRTRVGSPTTRTTTESGSSASAVSPTPSASPAPLSMRSVPTSAT